MAIYTITYTRGGRNISTSRSSDTAYHAIERLCDQYGWSCDLNQYDADTRGLDWAEARADTEYGINYNLRIVAVKR